MSQVYACTAPHCDRVFTKAYEFRKHKATHETPDLVFRCTTCEFITLQKKSLAIHIAIHTGEKMHACPDHHVDSSGQPERCNYRTNDPAALSKHRKKIHGYVPPANRSRINRDPIVPRKPRDDTRRCRRPQRFASVARRKPSRIGRAISYPNGASLLVSQGNTDENPIDVDHNDCHIEPGCVFGGDMTLFDGDDGMSLDRLYDLTLYSKWMAEYEAGYSSFDVTGMKYIPEPLRTASSAPVAVNTQTGREGCLCPEWMIEAGIEGWE